MKVNSKIDRIFVLAMVIFVGGLLVERGAAQPQSAGEQTNLPKAEPSENKPAEATGDAKATDEKPPVRKLDLSNPRATMRSFLLAMQEAAGDQPERIDDAIRCLDTSELQGDEDERKKIARSLAQRLNSIIEKRGVKSDDIPDHQVGDSYVFVRSERDKDATPDDKAPDFLLIEIIPNAETQEWLFSSASLDSIPFLEKQEQVAAKPKEAKSDVPAARQTPHATMATFLEAMNAQPPDLQAAVACLDGSREDLSAWEVRAPKLAQKLINTMDKIKPVLLSEIPNDPAGDPYVWSLDDAGSIAITRITEQNEKAGIVAGEWRFSAKTVGSIEKLYKAYEKKTIVKELAEAGKKENLTFDLWLQRQMPDWLRVEYLHIQGWQWAALVLLLPVGWLLKAFVSLVVSWPMRRWFAKKNIVIDRDMQRHVFASLGALAMALFWYFTIQNLDLSEKATGFLWPLTRLVVGVTIVWVGYRLVDVVGGQIAASKEVRLTHFDDVLIPLLRVILRTFVVVVALLLVLAWMGQEPTTVLGALGVGGVALAFAAQDTLGNFFGSITVLFDRPFGIGDWIVLGDVEGTVERVGFRSTRVRTFYNSVVTVPNSKMVNTQVDNYGARQYRRVRIMISVTYSTHPDKIDAFCEGIRELIRLHPYTRKDYYHVYLNQFAASSLDILLYTFFEVPEWGTELRERHRLFIDIMRLADRLGVEFAFPTQTLWVERSPKQDGGEPIPGTATSHKDAEQLGFMEAAALYKSAYGSESSKPPPVVIDRKPRSDKDA